MSCGVDKYTHRNGAQFRLQLNQDKVDIKWLSLLTFPSSVGKVPLKLLSDASKRAKFIKLPIVVGTSPLSSWRASTFQ